MPGQNIWQLGMIHQFSRSGASGDALIPTQIRSVISFNLTTRARRRINLSLTTVSIKAVAKSGDA